MNLKAFDFLSKLWNLHYIRFAKDLTSPMLQLKKRLTH